MSSILLAVLLLSLCLQAADPIDYSAASGNAVFKYYMPNPSGSDKFEMNLTFTASSAAILSIDVDLRTAIGVSDIYSYECSGVEVYWADDIMGFGDAIYQPECITTAIDAINLLIIGTPGLLEGGTPFLLTWFPNFPPLFEFTLINSGSLSLDPSVSVQSDPVSCPLSIEADCVIPLSVSATVPTDLLSSSILISESDCSSYPALIYSSDRVHNPSRPVLADDEVSFNIGRIVGISESSNPVICFSFNSIIFHQIGSIIFPSLPCADPPSPVTPVCSVGGTPLIFWMIQNLRPIGDILEIFDQINSNLRFENIPILNSLINNGYDLVPGIATIVSRGAKIYPVDILNAISLGKEDLVDYLLDRMPVEQEYLEAAVLEGSHGTIGKILGRKNNRISINRNLISNYSIFKNLEILRKMLNFCCPVENCLPDTLDADILLLFGDAITNNRGCN
jgi:hypothetical protein